MNISAAKHSIISLETRATLLVALSATLYGCLGFFGTKLIELHFTISAMLFWRFFIATLWMLPFVLKKTAHVPSSNFDKRQLCIPFILGGLCYAGNSAFYFAASHYTGTGLAMVIFFTYPMFVVLLAWLIDKYPISKHMAIALISIALGLLLLKGQQVNISNKTGMFFAI